MSCDHIMDIIIRIVQVNSKGIHLKEASENFFLKFKPLFRETTHLFIGMS